MNDKKINNTIYIFLGSPFSGKETQTLPLGKELNLPVFSMGALIRQARLNDPKIEDAFQKYSTNGLHVPIGIKFRLLQEEMDKNPRGFILDNFPATSEDLEVFDAYLKSKLYEVKKVFLLVISNEEMMRRYKNSPNRGRLDDTPEALATRGSIQSEERLPVLNHFKKKGKLVEVDGEKTIEEVATIIHNNL